MDYLVPENITPKTKEYVLKVLDFLKESDSYKDIDSGILDSLAYYYERFSVLNDAIQKTGNLIPHPSGILKDNPLSKKRDDCQIQLLKILQELGLTPKSREKLSLEKNKEENSPLKQFLSNV